jgi:hypothetical protein
MKTQTLKKMVVTTRRRTQVKSQVRRRTLRKKQMVM